MINLICRLCSSLEDMMEATFSLPLRYSHWTPTAGYLHPLCPHLELNSQELLWEIRSSSSVRFTVSLLFNLRTHFTGGFSSGYADSDGILEYNPAGDTWRQIGEMSTQRSASSVVPVEDISKLCH